jgi:hypothetical protein
LAPFYYTVSDFKFNYYSVSIHSQSNVVVGCFCWGDVD